MSALMSVCVSESRSICEPAGSVKRPQHDPDSAGQHRVL